MLSEEEATRNIPSIEIWVRKAGFKKKRVILTDKKNMEISLPYGELVAAYLEIGDKITGQISRPGLEDVTEDMGGSLILYDREYRRICVHTAGVRAGLLLKQLAVHAPYLFLGYMPWMDEGNQQEFFRMREMVSVMRAIG